MSQAGTDDVPHGYRRLALEGEFVVKNGEIFWRPEEDGISFGTRIGERHCNLLGTCHGGWIATYLDIVLPLTGRFTIPDFEERAMLTMNLSVDYLDAARSGDWLEGRASVLKRTGRMLFVQGMLQVGDRLVARGSAIFRIGPPAAPAR